MRNFIYLKISRNFKIKMYILKIVSITNIKKKLNSGSVYTYIAFFNLIIKNFSLKYYVNFVFNF